MQAIITAPIDGASKVFTNRLAREVAAADLYDNFKEHCPGKDWATWSKDFYEDLMQAREDEDE
jgi:hypothetical protein